MEGPMGAANSELPTPSATPPPDLRCAHCETPCPPANPIVSGTDHFCCHGCRYVHELIHTDGLERFYELRDQPLHPVSESVFQSRDLAWFTHACATSSGILRVELQGLSCIGCIWVIEHVFQSTPGTRNLQINPLTGLADLSFDPSDFTASDFARKLQRLGYLIGPNTGDAQSRPDPLVRKMGLCAALAMNAMLFAVPFYCGIPLNDRFAPWFERGALVCATLSLLIGGSHFFAKTFNALRQGFLHVDLPISLGLIAAYAGSVFEWTRGIRSGLYFDFVSVFTFLMLVGRWGHQRAVAANRKRLLSSGLKHPEPSKGDVYEIPQSRPVPVRSRLISEAADVSLEWINGESAPRTLHKGSPVPSGAVNLSRDPLQLVAEEDWKESLLHRLIHSEKSLPEADPVIHRFILGYIGVVTALAGAGLMIAVHKGAAFDHALQIAISVLVVSCPCATGVAIPLIHELAAQRLRSQGVFVRESSLWRRLLGVRKIAFDKTGTLTAETLQLSSTQVVSLLDPSALSALRVLVSDSMHPVASALRGVTGAAPTPLAPRTHASEVVGSGLEWRDDTGCLWRLGKEAWAVRLPPGTATDSGPGAVLSQNLEPIATFHCEETLRPDAVREVAELRALGITSSILSGDASARVHRVADALNIPRGSAFGDLSPDSKSDWLHRTQARKDTLMLGDGANDALAFNESLCCGTPAVDRGLLEHRCDFYFLGKGLRGVRELILMGRKKQQITHAVLLFAGVYNLVVIGISLSGHMHPLLASLLMPASSLATLGIVMTGFRKRSSD